MKEKKSTVITFRTTEATKKYLEIEAEMKGWSVSQVVERIVSAHYAQEKDRGNTVNINSNQTYIERIL